MKQLPVFDISGTSVDSLSLDSHLWDGPVNLRLLAQARAMYRARQRAGTASTKTRGDVSGGGKKPWKQKHTGRARIGSIRAPHWRHGGVIFGPHPRDFGYELPKQVRQKALLESLRGKLKDEELVVIDALRASEPKTKPFGKLSDTFKVTNKSVIVLEEFSTPLVRSLRNLAHFDLRRADDLNAHDVLNAQKLLVTKAAFNRLEIRVKSHATAKRAAAKNAGAA